MSLGRHPSLRVAIVSDLHGHLPVIPACDLLIISGDIAPEFDGPNGQWTGEHQIGWFNTTFRDWLHTVRAQEVVATPGNHDFGLFRWRMGLDHDIRWHLLIDNAVELFDYKIYGSPWVHNNQGWAYDLDTDLLGVRWKRIPDGVDILVLHQPPYGILDAAWRKDGKQELTGSRTLRERIDVVRPYLVTFGHIHEARGQQQVGPTRFVNASIRNRNYDIVGGPTLLRLDHDTASGVTSVVEDSRCVQTLEVTPSSEPEAA